MKIDLVKRGPWSDFTAGDPVGDVRKAVAQNAFAHITLHLSEQSIRDLFTNPDVCNVPRRDWKYLFQVDDVQMSGTARDFLGFASDDSGPALRVGSWYAAREANADLIAAAPDMLAALRAVVTDDTWGIDHPTYLQCRAAIRKAEGRE